MKKPLTLALIIILSFSAILCTISSVKAITGNDTYTYNYDTPLTENFSPYAYSAETGGLLVYINMSDLNVPPANGYTASEWEFSATNISSAIITGFTLSVMSQPVSGSTIFFKVVENDIVVDALNFTWDTPEINPGIIAIYYMAANDDPYSGLFNIYAAGNTQHWTTVPMIDWTLGNFTADEAYNGAGGSGSVPIRINGHVVPDPVIGHTACPSTATTLISNDFETGVGMTVYDQTFGATYRTTALIAYSGSRSLELNAPVNASGSEMAVETNTTTIPNGTTDYWTGFAVDPVIFQSDYNGEALLWITGGFGYVTIRNGDWIWGALGTPSGTATDASGNPIAGSLFDGNMEYSSSVPVSQFEWSYIDIHLHPGAAGYVELYVNGILAVHFQYASFTSSTTTSPTEYFSAWGNSTTSTLVYIDSQYFAAYAYLPTGGGMGNGGEATPSPEPTALTTPIPTASPLQTSSAGGWVNTYIIQPIQGFIAAVGQLIPAPIRDAWGNLSSIAKNGITVLLFLLLLVLFAAAFQRRNKSAPKT